MCVTHRFRAWQCVGVVTVAPARTLGSGPRLRVMTAVGLVVADLGDAVSLRLEDVQPVRRPVSWPHKRNYDGLWWSATTGGHVGFESLLESEYLLAADHDRDVVAISWQPFEVVWPEGSSAGRSHVPDYFVRLADGVGRVVDVKPAHRVGAAREQFEATAAVCAQVGWQYEVFTGLEQPMGANLAWLGGYRMDRYRPPSDLIDAVADAFVPATSLAVGLRRAARSLCRDHQEVHGWVLHLLFTGVLHADLTRALSMATTVTVAP